MTRFVRSTSGQPEVDASNTTASGGVASQRLLFWSVAATLFLVSSGLHFWKIGSAPAGFYIDESSHAYNAYSVALTGADEHGVRYPVFFRCFGEYKDPVMVYSMVPFIRFLGLERWVARLPSGLYLITAAIAFGFLVREYCASKWISLVAGFGFSLLPWVFVGSRTVTPYTPMLLGMLIGWLLLLSALERGSFGQAIGAGMAWAFAMYSYSVGRPMTILTLICFAFAYFGVLRSQWKIALVFVATGAAMLIPIAVSVALVPQALTARFGAISIFKDHPALSQVFSRVTSRYVEYFTPQFLFIHGDGILRQHSGFGGELFLFMVPMILAGLYCLLRFWKSCASYRFVGLGLLVYPAAAALTLNHMHSGRSINGAIFWSLAAAIGADFLWRKNRTGRVLLLLACFAGIIEVTLYIRDYFGSYQVRSRGAFQTAFAGVLDDCFRALGEGQTLYISDSVLGTMLQPANQDFKPYCYADILFFGRIDPRTYVKDGIPRDKVCLYAGVIRNPGLLIRCNLRLVKPRMGNVPPDYGLNDELIPPGATLVGIRQVGPLMRHEVYQVR